MAAVTLDRPAASRRRMLRRLNARGSRVFAYAVVGGWSLFTIFFVVWIILASLKKNRALVAAA
jgi:ABC-type glycerol-3-phosphate transport system permease component